MEIYLVMRDGTPQAAYWHRARAEEMAAPDGVVVPVHLENIGEVVRRYYDYRNLSWPREEDAFMFLTSELGEFGDALVSTKGDWIRNNPDRERDASTEAGDTLMMLVVTGFARAIDPITSLWKKLERKGFADKNGKPS